MCFLSCFSYKDSVAIELSHSELDKRQFIGFYIDSSGCYVYKYVRVFYSYIFINQNLELAIKLNFDGVHLTSQQFDKIKQAKEVGLKTIISCHTFEEVDKAISLGANRVTYSPIFYTPNKGEPKGIEKLCEAVEKYDIDIIALGGIISKEDIDEVKDSGAKGFASIRYFV